MTSEKKDQQSLFNLLAKSEEQPVVLKVSKTTSEFTLYVDGASRGNPGKSGAGVYLTENKKSVVEKGFLLGIRTNNEAEYLAMLLGVYFFKLHAKKDSSLMIISDSLLLIRQMQKMYKVKKPELQKFHTIATHELTGFKVSFQHVEREYNTIADALANDGVDKKTVVPLKFLDMLSTYEFYF